MAAILPDFAAFARAYDSGHAQVLHARLIADLETPVSAFLKLGEELQKTPLGHPRFTVICNVDATPVREEEEIRSALQDQVTGTVRWTETMEYLVDQEKCDLFLELGPGGVLAGLLNRTRKGTPCVSISDVPSLDAALGALRG